MSDERIAQFEEEKDKFNVPFYKLVALYANAVNGAKAKHDYIVDVTLLRGALIQAQRLVRDGMSEGERAELLSGIEIVLDTVQSTLGVDDE